MRCEGGDQSGDQSKETGANAGQEGSGEQNGRQKQRVHLCRANKLKDAVRQTGNDKDYLRKIPRVVW